MGFKITSGVPERMFPGQIISYQIGLLPGIKSSWVTEITHVRERQFLSMSSALVRMRCGITNTGFFRVREGFEWSIGCRINFLLGYWENVFHP
jgi:hypothetical protein